MIEPELKYFIDKMYWEYTKVGVEVPTPILEAILLGYATPSEVELMEVKRQPGESSFMYTLTYNAFNKPGHLIAGNEMRDTMAQAQVDLKGILDLLGVNAVCQIFNGVNVFITVLGGVASRAPEKDCHPTVNLRATTLKAIDAFVKMEAESRGLKVVSEQKFLPHGYYATDIYPVGGGPILSSQRESLDIIAKLLTRRGVLFHCTPIKSSDANPKLDFGERLDFPTHLNPGLLLLDALTARPENLSKDSQMGDLVVFKGDGGKLTQGLVVAEGEDSLTVLIKVNNQVSTVTLKGTSAIQNLGFALDLI